MNPAVCTFHLTLFLIEVENCKQTAIENSEWEGKRGRRGVNPFDYSLSGPYGRKPRSPSEFRVFEEDNVPQGVRSGRGLVSLLGFGRESSIKV